MSKREFEKFYQEHFDKVYRFIFFRLGGNKEQAEDLVSEIFIKALKSFEKYDKTISSSAWIMTIARNYLINFWRDSKPVTFLPETSDSDQEASLDSMAFKMSVDKWKNSGQDSEIYDILAKLDQGEAEIVTLHYIIGYSYSEIAEEKGMSEGAVKVAAHRAVKKMKALIL